MVNTTLQLQASAARRSSIEQIWEWLVEISDPEIPVVSIVDLGIVRNVIWDDERDTCIVTITPTYSGCPAMAVIQSLIREELTKRGIPSVLLQIQLSPAWTTDWLTQKARERLHAFRIAPPEVSAPEEPVSKLPVLSEVAQACPACPHCGSTHTTTISQFGSTLCKALYRCEDCLEPFDYFKHH